MVIKEKKKRKSKKITKKVLLKKENKLRRRNDKILWEVLRNQVKILQNNCCYVCNDLVTGQRANVHHLISREFKPLKWDVNNLILVCPRCHKFGSLSCHKSSLYIGELIRVHEPQRYKYLIDKINENLGIQ